MIAACSLRSKRRWAVSGTPIQNRLEDLYSLVKFLKLEPWSNFSFWKAHIDDPFERGDERAVNTLGVILSQGMLRRTKESRGPYFLPVVFCLLATHSFFFFFFCCPCRQGWAADHPAAVKGVPLGGTRFHRTGACLLPGGVQASQGQVPGPLHARECAPELCLGAGHPAAPPPDLRPPAAPHRGP